jgi:hypothetical protein
MKDMGCSGGKMAYDTGNFEVDNAKCQGGKRYDLTFDKDFKLTNKEPEKRAGRNEYYGSARHNKRRMH